MSSQESIGDGAYRDPSAGHTHSTGAVCRPQCPGYKSMLREKTAARFGLPQAQNDRGEWVPIPPEPLFVGFGLRKSKCSCGETFRDRIAYRGHYALAHILGLS